MTRSPLSLLKSLGVLSASMILFGCPEPDEPRPQPEEEMGITRSDMGVTDGEEMGPKEDGGEQDMGASVGTPLDRARMKRDALGIDFICEMLFECPERLEDFLLYIPQFQDKEACKASADEPSSDLDETLGLEQGRLRGHDANVAACLSEPELDIKLACSTEQSAFDAFDNSACFKPLVEGVVPRGGGCMTSQDCAGEESYCSTYDMAAQGDTCLGVCQVFGEYGCTEECAEGQRCDFDRNACVPLTPIGQACSFDGECVQDAFCEVDVNAEEGLCTSLARAGEACDTKFDCAMGLTCQFGEDFEGTCEVALMMGEECFSSECAETLYCENNSETFERTCEPRLEVGQPCEYSSSCQQGLSCIVNEQGEEVCRGPGAVGESCSYDGQCEEALSCIRDDDQGEGVCRGPGAVGDSCSYDGQCGEDLSCIEDEQGEEVCRGPGAAGESCSYDDQCGEELFCPKK